VFEHFEYEAAARVLTLYPLAHKTSCKKCVACFWAKVPEVETLGKTKNNTNNFPENSRKMHKINSLGCCPLGDR